MEQEQARLVDLIMEPAISDIVKRSVNKRCSCRRPSAWRCWRHWMG